MKNVENILIEYGLSAGESKVYLAMINYNLTTIIKISEHTQIKRGTVYLIIKKLIKNSLVRISVIGKKRYFIPEKPELLLDNLENKKEKLKEIIPYLKTIYNAKSDFPEVNFYEGRENVKKIYSDMMKSKTEILSFGPAKETFEEFRDVCLEIDDYKKTSQKFKGSREIVNNNKFDKNYRDETLEYDDKIKVRCLPGEHFIKDCDNLIYDNKLVILSIKNDFFAIVIDSAVIANTYRMMFELAWEACRKNH
jgi:HTH-type transcriptional regulator, sugar sensing transcriptional regulator